MAELTQQELAEILGKLDELCRQSQELQKQIREKMAQRRNEDQPAESDALKKRR